MHLGGLGLHKGGLHSGGSTLVGLGRPPSRALQDKVNKWAVCILLECILVEHDMDFDRSSFYMQEVTHSRYTDI